VCSMADGSLKERTVVLLVGGTSTEREVSLQSGRALLAALDGLAAEGRIGDRRLIEITADGHWLEDGASCLPLESPGLDPARVVLLLGLHGGSGEDGTLQGALALRGLRHTGSGVAASALGMDKWASRLLAEAHGLRVAQGVLADGVAPVLSGTGPWFVKPRRGGSSVATTRVDAAGDIADAIDAVVATGDQALIETAVEGVELTVGVVETPSGEPQALPLVEIVPHEGRFFDFEEKYSSQGAREVCPPESVSDEQAAAVAALGLAAYRALGCRGYARIDFILPAEGDAVFLEANTLPGFTPRSLLPQAAAAVGLSFEDLVERVLERALA
jgi:D-alanine-D-alanine ligase